MIAETAIMLMLSPDTGGIGIWLRKPFPNNFALGIQASTYYAEDTPGIELMPTATGWSPGLPLAVSVGVGASKWSDPMPDEGEDFNFTFSLRAEWADPSWVIQPSIEWKHWSNGKEMFGLNNDDNPGSDHLMLNLGIPF